MAPNARPKTCSRRWSSRPVAAVSRAQKRLVRRGLCRAYFLRGSDTSFLRICVGSFSWALATQIPRYHIGVAVEEHRGRKSREAIYAQLAEGVDELRTRLGGLP